MTTAAGAEEVSFLRAMEREPPKEDWHEVTIKVESLGRKVFAADGMVDRLHQKLRRMLNLRGPEDFEKPEEDIAERVARILAKKYATRQVTYNNGDGSSHGNGEKRLLRWILGVLSALVVLAIAGGVTLYGEFTALKATVTTGMTAHEQRLSRVEQRLDRTSANAP
jgi:hypothetical protein